MISTPFIYQLLVSGSILLAALSVGCAVTYPGVLLKQLAADNSTIRLDLDTASWMGSIHGLAGIPSILMPALMQWRGRKVTFTMACLFSITGWILAYTSTNPTTILISESFHGFGAQSVMAVGSLSMSEMLSPEFRQVAMSLYLVMQGIGMAVVDVIGWYLDWKTVSLITSIPITIAAFAACLWPESPSWLACRGEFDKCTKAFIRLRGNSDPAKRELEDLIAAQKENLSSSKRDKHRPRNYFYQMLNCRDFYLPTLHMFIIILVVYWSGCMIPLIYNSDIMKYKLSQGLHHSEGVINNFIYLLGNSMNIFLKYKFEQKKIFLAGAVCAVVCMLSSAAVNYSDTVGLMSDDSNICFYFLLGYMISMSSCVIPTVFVMASELMPVKYRGVGGPLYVIFVSTMHSSSLKLAPYLFLYINLWGTFLLYALNAIFCTLFIWKYVPETKGKTLQQLEDYYAYGSFDKARRYDAKHSIDKLMTYS